MFIHNDSTDILQHVQKDCVPSDFGGSDKSIKELGGVYSGFKLHLGTKFNINMRIHLFIELAMENVLKERELFMNGLWSLKADMDKKPKDTFYTNEQSELFGIDGNFKQLNID